ncbi:S-adenosylmethionine decarboxylase proenzyme [Podospora australis]|uniref:adenosylmethionine decarboxylase n=1 Tax=Podospora australis TaxID=1536484 RepID=A0AAN6WT94_9PEZI|nr:S-adenosylmethionine decarboxylase proenzyme [Podospora australis]
MVNTEITNGTTVAPSEGAPHLTINHEVAADLDSTNAFEGPEKLLEVWFAPSPKALPAGVKEGGLKSVPAATWEGMLDMVNCKVLSIVNSDNVDAYLLSESSMFVFPHKLILKTCGTTTLLLGLRRLLRIAAVDAGFPFHNAQSLEESHVAATPHRVFYSRKNFLFPDRQRGPHSSWKEEVKFLDDMFENGSAYLVGRMNADHWYLYMTSPTGAVMTPPRTPTSSNGGSPTRASKIPTGIIAPYCGAVDETPDETLEVLMMDLDPELAKQYYLEQASAVARKQVAAQEDAAVQEALTTEGHALGTVVSDACGLSAVYPTSEYPDARIDAYLFSPCGFSANGVVPAPVKSAGDGDAKAEHYFTVHVTPEPICSFASFETNVPGGQNGRQTSDVIDHVVNIFKPGRFTVTLFETKNRPVSPPAGTDEKRLEPAQGAMVRQRMDRIEGYRRKDRIVHEFEDYDLVFRYYEREGWAGDKNTRVGEDE